MKKWLIGLMLLVSACGPTPGQQGRDIYAQGAPSCNASRTETQRVECYYQLYTAQFSAERLAYGQFLPAWHTERLQIASDYETGRIAPSMATALIQQSDDRMMAAAQANRNDRLSRGADDPVALKLLNFAGSTAQTANMASCISLKNADSQFCREVRAQKEYEDCLKLHDKYICQPYRKEAGYAD